VYARATTSNVNLTAGSIVGRGAELEALSSALDALEAGEPGWIAVEGEPGIGKTRLLDELRAFAEDRGHLVLAGGAAEFERDMPFSVWADALDAYVAAQDLTAADRFNDELAAELAGILPSLRRTGAVADPSIADERFRAHRAVRDLLELLAAGRPLVLVLDDLQWVDRASSELLAALVRRPPEAPVLIAVAARRGQLPERLVAALAAPAVRRLRLAPLSEGDAGRLLGDDLAPGAVAELYRHGGGNPFYLEQLARAGAGALAGVAPGDGAGVPPAVAASLADELASLTAASRPLLEAAAVAGEPFEADLAAAVAELRPADGLVALDDLLARDLVRATEVPRRFVFRHPLVRRAVYDRIRGGTKLAAHARAAAALEARGSPVAERARHVAVAAAPGDEAAIGILVAAGIEAQARAPATAARWFEAALALLPAADGERQVELRVALASAQRSLGELERCRATLLEAAGLLAADDGARRVELTARVAAVDHWLGRHDDAHERLVAAWEALPEKGTAQAVALLIELSVDGLYEPVDIERAQAMGAAALEVATALGDPALIGTAAAALALAEAAAGRMAEARGHRDVAAAHLEALPDAELAPRLEALYYLGWAENYLERYDDAIARSERAIAIGRATGEGRLLVPLMLMKGYPYEMQGRLAEAVADCDTAVEIARLSTNPHDLFWALFELGWARYFSGDLDAAIAACQESARVGGRMTGGTMPSAGGGPGWALGVASFEVGEHARAFEILDQLGGDDHHQQIPVERCFDYENLTLAALARDRPEEADDWAGRAEADADRLGLELPRALASRSRAAVLLEAGHAAAAAAACERSIAAAEAIGAGLQAAFSRTLQGHALAAAGDRTAAIATWRTAEHALDAYGSVRVRDEVRRALRRFGARVEPRGPATPEDSGVAALTPREREIADLVRDRLTNREIAGRLFLSDKTIESHLRNVFIKLGVSSRVEVARTIERDG
jgi:DNA-binding NarL/FixJ family response regulator/tetratricopeptide (TPR) repeat protein